MSWKFPWSEFVKKRACRYLLQHYLGHFLKEKLTLDQLSVDLYNGTGKIRQLDLDVEAINEVLDNSNLPVEIVDGFIDEIAVSIPWTALIQSSTEMEIRGLELTLQPKQRSNSAQGLETMFCSMNSSMSTSLQIAEECLKEDRSKPMKGLDGGLGDDGGQQFEGVQKFAQTIDSVLCRVKVTLVDTVIRLEHLPNSAETGVALEIKIKRMEYFDDMAEGSSVDNPQFTKNWEPAAVAHKNFLMEGLHILIDHFSRNSRPHSDHSGSSCSSPQNYESAASSPLGLPKNVNQSSESTESPDQCEPIQIAVVTGKTSLKLKIKQADSVTGPKLETEVELGALHILLAPRQVHSLLEIMDGLISPGTNEAAKRRHQSNRNKPMSAEDMQRIERELQRQMMEGRVQSHKKPSLDPRLPMGMHDIMTTSMEEEECYFSLNPAGKSIDMESSVSSNFSLASNRTASTVTSRQPSRAPKREPSHYKSKDTLQRILDDPSAELCRYHLRLTFFTISILHENPRPVLGESNEQSEQKNKMKGISEAFFKRVFTFLPAGKSELRQMRKHFAEALHCDHLRFVGKPLNLECVEKTVPTHYSTTIELTIGLFEGVECLFDRRNESMKPEYTELLVFHRDVVPSPIHSNQMYSSMHGGAPCVKATVKSLQQLRGSQKANSFPKTDISIVLAQLESEVDITIVDRINSLIKPEPTRRPYSTSVATNISGGMTSYALSQALDDGPGTQEHKYDLQISCPSAKLSLRFPIPDLRPLSQVDKLPWWQKNLRDEILILQMSDVLFQTSFLSSQSITELDITCRDVHAFFKIDPIKEEPEPFAFVGGDENEDGCNNFPRLSIKFSNKTTSVLEEEPVESEDNTPQDSFNGACLFTKRDPSPFSNKKNMYGKEEYSEKDQSTHVSEEMIMPGDRREIQEFQEKSLSNTHMTLEFSLPFVNLHIPDKHFYEVLYNRINSDLLLWEPMAPSPLQTQDLLLTAATFDLSCYPNALQDSFHMAKSAIKYESSDEEDDSSFGYYSIHDSRYPRRKPTKKEQPSKMCLSVKIDKGKLTAITNSYEEKVHGEVVIMLEDATIFTVANHNGDPSLQYVCFLSHKAELYHCAAVDDVFKEKAISLTREDVCRIPDHLRDHRLVHKTDPGVMAKSMDTSYDIDTSDMVSVAVKIKLDSTPINDLTKDEKIKEFLVAVGIRGGTLQHKMAAADQSWIAQIMAFLDVKDYDILGYTMAKVLTELHVHLWDCAVDYRPLHIKTNAVLMAESFSISSNIIAESPTSLLRFVLDDASLFLSQKPVNTMPNLKKDYVCVADLERFELSLRFSDGKDLKFPKTDLKVLTNRLNLRTCSDSCKALMELIQYFASDGDLYTREGTPSIGDSTQDLVVGDELQESGTDDEDVGLTVSRQGHLETLVEDAMLESQQTANLPENGSPSSTTQVYFVANGGATSQPVPPAGGIRPIVISDSADSFASSALSERMEVMSDDEEFCVIDDPGLGIMPRDGEPSIRVLVTDPVEIKENFFSQPLGRTDLLKAPDHYPLAEQRYTLKEMTLVWYMYGGSDFRVGDLDNTQEKEVVYSTRSKDHGDGSPLLSMRYTTKSNTENVNRSPWRSRGGPGRDNTTLMELQLTKVQMQHERYPSNTEQASRQILLISDLELRDRLTSSNINKFLYRYSSESMPRQSNANMLLVKAIHTRPDPTVKAEECALRISVQPLRLNVDQDSFAFLKTFFTEVSGGGGHSNPSPSPPKSDTKPRSRSASGTNAPSPPPPVMVVGHPEVIEEETDPQELLMRFDELQEERLGGEITTNDANTGFDNAPIPAEEEEEASYQPVFFKSFIFSPDVPIRLDYTGKKRVDREHGALTGLLAGLAQLNCSELKLKGINHQHGLLGLDRLLQYAINEWLTDIRKNQLPSILGGVGPMHSFVQLAQGMKDLFWLPVEQYRKDGRIVRGIQRGASSFTTSTAMAVLELTNRVVQSVQYVAEVTFDMVSPGPSVRNKGLRRRKKYGRSGQPADLREGMTNAYIVLKEGFSDTAQNIVLMASKEHEQKGVTGAMGGVIRQIPPTVISPLIIASEATSNVLGGMRNQIKPDARKEDEEKWKSECIS